jgi:hypothetical protein
MLGPDIAEAQGHIEYNVLFQAWSGALEKIESSKRYRHHQCLYPTPEFISEKSLVERRPAPAMARNMRTEPATGRS